MRVAMKSGQCGGAASLASAALRRVEARRAPAARAARAGAAARCPPPSARAPRPGVTHAASASSPGHNSATRVRRGLHQEEARVEAHRHERRRHPPARGLEVLRAQRQPVPLQQRGPRALALPAAPRRSSFNRSGLSASAPSATSTPGLLEELARGGHAQRGLLAAEAPRTGTRVRLVHLAAGERVEAAGEPRAPSRASPRTPPRPRPRAGTAPPPPPAAARRAGGGGGHSRKRFAHDCTACPSSRAISARAASIWSGRTYTRDSRTAPL